MPENLRAFPVTYTLFEDGGWALECEQPYVRRSGDADQAIVEMPRFFADLLSRAGVLGVEWPVIEAELSGELDD